MSRQNYTNRIGNITTTTLDLIYTVPDKKMAIFSNSYIKEKTGNTPTIKIQIIDSSDTAFTIVDTTMVAGAETSVVPQPLVLDEKEKIKMQAGTADRLNYFFGFVEIDQGINNKYLNKMQLLETTDTTTLYTVPADSTAIILSYYSMNTSASNVAGNSIYFSTSGGTDVLIDAGTATAKGLFTHLQDRTHVLQEGQSVKYDAGAVDVINTFVSVLEMKKAGGSASG